MRILSSGLYLFWQMHRNARVVAPGIPYHVTQRGTNREQVFFAIVDFFVGHGVDLVFKHLAKT